MIEVQKRLFNQMVDYLNDLGNFSKSLSGRELKKRSDIRAAINSVLESTQDFKKTLKDRSPSMGPSAKSMSVFNKGLKEIERHLVAIDRGINDGTLASLTAVRNAVRQHVNPIYNDFVSKQGTKFVPVGVTPEELEKEANFSGQKGDTRNTQTLLRKAAKNIDKKEHKDSASIEQQAKENDQLARTQLAKFAQHKNRLPRKLDGKLFRLVQGMPIVPSTPDYSLLSPKFLNRIGADFTLVGVDKNNMPKGKERDIPPSFVVLENQMLLAFDFKAATNNKRSSLTTKTSLTSRKRKAANQTAQEDFVLEIINAINERFPEPVELVSAHFEHHPNSVRIAYAWIMPLSVKRMFDRRGDLGSSSWGFPWQMGPEL